MKITVIEKFNNGKLTERTVIQEDEHREISWLDPQVLHGDEWWKKVTCTASDTTQEDKT